MIQFTKLEGLIAPVFTPMHSNCDIHTDIIPGYADFLRGKKINGVFALGSSGEGVLLTVEERKAVAEKWAAERSDDLKLIIHVGATSYRDAQELALHAKRIGADAISLMGPTFLQPKNVSDLIHYCKLVASAVPDMPCYYYNIPQRTGIMLDMNEFLEESFKEIPNMVGIKYTNSNFMEMQQCIHIKNGIFDILHGSDETLLCGLSVGIKGGIGTTYNFASQLYKQLIEAFQAGDLEKARQLQLKSVELIKLIVKYRGGIIAGKTMMKIAGIDCGPCRSPLRSVSNEEELAMLTDLKNKELYTLITE